MGRHTFTFMGTGAGCGVPSFFCDCPACTEARAHPELARGDCGVMIRGEKTLLIDAPPDTRHQLIRESIETFDRLLLTHAHYDHIGGIGEYEYLVQLKTKEPLPVWASEATIEGVRKEFHYMTYAMDFHPLAPFDSYEFDNVRYTALPVTHAKGTFGYLIETADTKLFYASDTGQLPKDTQKIVRKSDIIIMDATFWKNNWSPQAHHSIQECIDEALELECKHVYLTHMCLHYDEPITVAELKNWLEYYNGQVEPAMDGLSFEI